MTNNYSALKIILWVFLVALLAMAIIALNKDSHYKFDIPMCIFLLAIIYYVKEKIFLHWLHYLLFSSFLIIHCLGMYDLYETYPLGIEYDYWVHSIFGFIFVLIMFRWEKYSIFNRSFISQASTILIAVLGISAAHELYEFAGAMLLGQGEGVLFIGAGDLDEWDTQKDMLNNLIGGCVGIIAYKISDYIL